MTQIILVRHGETQWNVGEIFRGTIDVELNETGNKQAELLADYLSQIKIDAIYSSPLKRALKTAQIIAGHHNLIAESTPALNDLNFGEWQSLTIQQVKEKYPKLYSEWANFPHLVKLPGGENLDDVKMRAVRLVDEVIARYKGNVVLVSHRVVNKVLILALLGLDNSHFWNIKLDTCGVTTFDYENGRFVLTRHNDTSFLQPLKKPVLKDF
ncbi:MAG: histidine phosphatase family protein [Chloroflexota bacterium]